MKWLLMLMLICIISRVISTNTVQNYLPNLPFGEYTVYCKAYLRCKLPTDPVFLLNLYMYKTSSNTSEVRGNVTLKKPLDDSFNLHLNMAVKDSIGGWKDNAYVFRTTKACSTAVTLLGPMLPIISHYFNTSLFACPVPAGVYVTKGYDLTDAISKSNVPKQLFYGSYKFRIEVLDKHNNLVGCSTAVVDIKRPWETE